ncbi:aminotransferase-like domain-containing protein [Streptococcus cameli]
MASKYQTIMNTILQGIENGSIKRGQKLPSIRQLSQEYQCSKDTVQKAFLELKYQKVIYAVEKSGYYVLEDKAFQEEQIPLASEDFHQLPYEDFRLCLNESLIGRENYLFNYYHQQEGLEELISSTQQLLMDYQVFAKKEQIAITAGTQQALYVLSRMSFPSKRETILLEHPTYDRMQHLLDQQEIPYRLIERDLDGIDLDELEKQFQEGDIKFFYTIPRLHNPLGTSYSLQEKEAILRLAQTYQVYIVEDDYLADFDLEQVLPFHYLDTEDRVIYLKSFTTTLFPALRIGSVVLPPALIERFLEDKGLIDYDTNLIMQKALSLYIDNGMFARNTKHLKDAHRQQQERLGLLVKESGIRLPYQITKDAILFQLPKKQLTPKIKHSGLPLTLMENKESFFIRLTDSAQLQKQLMQITKLLQ